MNRIEAHAEFDRLLDLVEQWQNLADDEYWDVDRSADTEEQIYITWLGTCSLLWPECRFSVH